ncbi:hypothetical protein [Candidatus Xiphinematobacter sp. Idaho Grape]|uniref:hypothetical protein n=1 Tax=Candidatus Xiphinematobacter sp. Idaho Grape TaxID=1704307 RepID=UPI000781226A|nr:hypothetical protein [Candidatus Xiphinematobacter sp. Idaho Grape]
MAALQRCAALRVRKRILEVFLFGTPINQLSFNVRVFRISQAGNGVRSFCVDTAESSAGPGRDADLHLHLG